MISSWVTRGDLSSAYSFRFLFGWQPGVLRLRPRTIGGYKEEGEKLDKFLQLGLRWEFIHLFWAHMFLCDEILAIQIQTHEMFC